MHSNPLAPFQVHIRQQRKWAAAKERLRYNRGFMRNDKAEDFSSVDRNHAGNPASDSIDRRQVLIQGPSVSWWIIEELEESIHDLEAIDVTLRTPSRHFFSLDEYVVDRAGWVSPLQVGLTSISQVRSLHDDATPTEVSKHVTTEVAEIAGLQMKVRAYSHEFQKGKPTKTAGHQIRKDTGQAQKDGKTVHTVVWLQPSEANLSDDSGKQLGWLNACLDTVRSFVNDRVDEGSLKWIQAANWLSVLHTPWATFATWSPGAQLQDLSVVDARVRHLVVDPVVLATAQLIEIGRHIDSIAALGESERIGEGCCSLETRDQFYRWRSRYWWEQPARSSVPVTVWKGAAEANNLAPQVESISREMVEYANVQEGNHNRKIEGHNVRLTVGGLVFAILAILTPILYEEVGLIPAAVTVLLAVAVSILWYTWRIRKGRSSRFSASEREVSKPLSP